MPTKPADVLLAGLAEPYAAPAPLVLHDPQPLQATVGQRLRVHAAIATWFAGIFGLVYLAGGAAMYALGWANALTSLLPNALAFALVVPALLLGLELTKPKMYLERSLDPVLPAAAGGFLAWATLHNTLGILRPFSHFSTGELAVFLTLNALEFTLIGAVLATLVRTRAGGFALGFAFQLAYLFAFLVGAALIF